MKVAAMDTELTKIKRMASDLAAIAAERALSKDWQEHPMAGITVDHDKWAVMYQNQLQRLDVALRKPPNQADTQTVQQAEGGVHRVVGPCWICGSSDGELFPSINDGPPFHKPCAENFRAEMIGCLNALIDCVPPWHEKLLARIKQLYTKVTL